MVGLILMPGCGSISRHHQIDGEQPQKPIKIPGSMGLRATLRSTIGATVRAPVAATRTGLATIYDRLHMMVRGTVPMPKLQSLKSDGLPDRAGGEAFEAVLDREELPRRTRGAVDFFVDGEAFFPPFVKRIREARRSVDVQSYIFDNDDFAVEVADILKAKSMEVPVRVYFDGLGTMLAVQRQPPSMPPQFQQPKDIRRYLAEGSKIDIRRTANPYFVADHTKLHLVDGQTAFVGGMNIGREYRSHWHDLMARIEGPVVADLVRLFERGWEGEEWLRNWGLSGFSRRPANNNPPNNTVARGRLLPIRVLTTDATIGRRDVLKATLIGIRCAARRIWIETPYFTSDEVAAELERAVARGVDVRIIIPGDNESKFMHAVNLASLRSLLIKGAKVYSYPGMTHLKATVCDDWAMFGSANYDTLSLRINRELNLATSDPRTVKALASKVFEKDFRVSTQLTPEQVIGQGNVLAELIGDQL